MKLEVELDRYAEKLWKAILEDEDYVECAGRYFEEAESEGYDWDIADQYAKESTKMCAISAAIVLLYKKLQKPRIR